MAYFTFRPAQDEWAFEVGGLVCRVLNDWRAGMRLFAGEQLVAENTKQFSLNTRGAFMSASIRDSSGRSQRVEVFVKAVIWVDIRVCIDGRALRSEYV